MNPMKTKPHLIDKIKSRLGVEEEEEDGDKFPDMHYLVGNTSGLDIGQVPGPIAQRVGRMAQIGGELMEIQISNPATFKIDRPELMRVIDGIGFERVTLHGDPNIGFTGAYATRGQGVTGYNIVHRYFKRYLEQMASFKEQADKQYGIKIGYVNMHASNEQIPPREEQIASDKSLDPFGTRFTEVIDKPEYAEDKNMYENQEFMEKLFDFLVMEKLERMEEYRLYNQIFSSNSDEFERNWSRRKNKWANQVFRDKASTRQEKKDLLEAAGAASSTVDDRFHDILEEVLPEEVREIVREQSARLTLPGLGRLSQVFEILDLIPGIIEEAIRGGKDLEPRDESDVEEWKDRIIDQTSQELWLDLEERDEGVLPYDAKLRALVNVRDNVTQRDIEEPAAEDFRDYATRTFSGDPECFTEKELDREDHSPHLNIMEDIIRQTGVGREIEKESTVFFNILPAWMQSKDEDSVPRFIWNQIVERNNDKDLDLSDFDKYQQFLEDARENELNVIAAVGVCYLWGHFTQKKDEFDFDVFEPMLDKYKGQFDLPEAEGENGSKKLTWIEWMHRFNLRVNIEAMYGEPGQLRRVWRPKDIAIACHAIDKQAKKDIEDWTEEDDLVKFTIDMEHTASYGVDPWNEMQKLIEQEQDMAEDNIIEVDPDKALSKIVKTYHLTKPGWEQSQGHRHGPFARGDETLYQWLYNMVDAGFARNEDEKAIVMFEVGGEYREEMYTIRVALDMIRRGIKPEKLNPEDIPIEGEYETTEQALMARFFGLDKPQFNSEMTKIEEHAFDPLDNLLESESFDHTYSGSGYIQGGGRPGEWMQEEYQ